MFFVLEAIVSAIFAVLFFYLWPDMISPYLHRPVPLSTTSQRALSALETTPNDTFYHVPYMHTYLVSELTTIIITTQYYKRRKRSTQNRPPY